MPSNLPVVEVANLTIEVKLGDVRDILRRLVGIITDEVPNEEYTQVKIPAGLLAEIEALIGDFKQIAKP